LYISQKISGNKAEVTKGWRLLAAHAQQTFARFLRRFSERRRVGL